MVVALLGLGAHGAISTPCIEMRLNDDGATEPIHSSLADEFPPATERSCSQLGYGIFWRQVFKGLGPLPSIPTLNAVSLSGDDTIESFPYLVSSISSSLGMQTLENSQLLLFQISCSLAQGA